MRKRGLHQALHPFDDQPFEVFYLGSWKIVERLRISDGTITFNFPDLGYQFEQKHFLPTLRLQPRRATLTDCTCVLRPGADVSVLSISESSENSSEESCTGWYDARITSIERIPHGSGCNCKFYIKFFYISDDAGTDRRKLSKDVEAVGIDKISVLQILQQKPSENTHYRWNLAEDCTSASRNKLFLGKFASDISWLLVASVQKQIVFDVRSIDQKLVYQILDGSFNTYSTSVNLSAVNFKIDGGITSSVIFPFVPVDNVKPTALQEVKEEVDPITCYEVMDLRRSKRRNVQPERYLGDIGLEETDTTALRIGYKRWDKDDELAIVLADGDDMSAALLEESEENFERAVEMYSGDTYLVSKVGVEGKKEKAGKDVQLDEGSEGRNGQGEKESKRKYVQREKESTFRNVQGEKETKVRSAQTEKEKKGTNGWWRWRQRRRWWLCWLLWWCTSTT